MTGRNLDAAGSLTAQQSWRPTHFGTTSHIGTTGDTSDAAFGLSPAAGTSMQFPMPQRWGHSGTTHLFSVPVGGTETEMFIRLEVTAAP